MSKITSSLELARYIDHSILKPNIIEPDIIKEIDNGIACNVASICIMPHYLPLLVEKVKGTETAACTVTGFPLGYTSLMEKIFNVRQSISMGAKEIDYVLNINDILSGKWADVENEIGSVTHDCHSRDAKVKFIFENCYLQDIHKIKLTRLCSDYDADWVKTSTGFGTSGATLPDVCLMVQNCSNGTQVKAAGGIKTLDDMLGFIDAGVTRVGCSLTKKILEDAKVKFGK